MTEPISLIFVTGLAAFVVGLSEGGLPSIGTLGVPVMALLMSPVLAAALLLPIYLATDLVGLWLYRRDYSARNLAILVPAGLAGVLVGWAIAARVSDTLVGLLVGLAGIGCCSNTLLRHRRAASPRPADVPRGAFWGPLVGFTSFVSHSGPLFKICVLPQRLEKLTFAGTSTILFAVVNWMEFPVRILGAVAGAKLTRVLSDGLFFLLVDFALLTVSLKLVFDAFRAG
jgi:uncharacterized protein